MQKSQLFLSSGAIVLIVVLCQLPRVVVENDQLQEVTDANSHSFEIPFDVRARMSELRRLMMEEENVDKKANFAYLLASYYLDYGALDSAVRLGEKMEEVLKESSEKVADIYFKAFERSQALEESRKYAVRAQEILSALLAKEPANLVLKNKLAMTLMSGENPMAGIAVLREILEEDENNRQAILNLGLLSIQSGQFDKAGEHFDKLVSLDVSDHEARLYLAVSMIETNKQLRARPLLEEIINSKDSIPAIKMMAMEYLNEL